MSWFAEQRQNWIKEMLRVYGFINRNHVQKKFGVSTAQAAVDFRAVMARWPDLMEYDTNMKCYVEKRK